MATSVKASQRLSVPNAKSLKSSKFIPFRPVSQRNVKARAAAVDEDLDFSFSLSDAKKNNSYEASEVANALNFYQEGGSAPAYELDQITNVFGVEDASLFADIDDEEAYADEYIVAGIPEAAPKRRGRGGRQQAGAQAEDDDLEQAKALDKVKAMEDRMVLEAAMEEDFGDAGSAAAAVEVKGQGVWDWLTDLENKEVDEEAKEMPAAIRSTGAGALSDVQVATDITFAKPEMFQDTDVSNYLELFGTDDVNEAVLAAADESTDVPELASELTDEDMARIDALLAQEIPVFESKSVAASSVPVLEDEPEMDKAVVDQYIATIRAAASATGASESEYSSLFGGESYTIEAAEPAEDAAAAAETQELLAAAEPALDGVSIDFDAEAAAVESTADEPAEEDDAGLERELRALAAIEEFGEDDFGNDELLETIESYVVSAEDYVAQDEERKAALAAAVARGELSADVLADELEDMPDAVDEMVAEVAVANDDDVDMSLVDEDDGEQWQERILELTRVTKVTKGGKVMGFRCVAVVGNQNGLVGVGCQAGREVAVAVKRTLVDAKRNVVRVPLVGAGTVPHRSEAKYHAARCLVLPASDGTGCIAGGSVRSVLELAGVKNCLAKRIGSRSALNSARATVKALTQMQTLHEVAKARGVPMDQLLLQ